MLAFQVKLFATARSNAASFYQILCYQGYTKHPPLSSNTIK